MEDVDEFKNKITALEYQVKSIEKEVGRLEEYHHGEVHRIQNSLENQKKAINEIQDLVKQIKYYILGIATVFVASEIGITALITSFFK